MKGSLFSSEVAEPYAQALMSLAADNHIMDRFADDCREIIRVLEESSDLSSLIVNPTIGEPEKKRVLGEVIGRDVDGYLERFLMLLVDKKRLMFLEPICQQYLALWRKSTNTVLAEVTAARDLNDDQRYAIEDKVKQLTHAESVELKISIDPDIIGGVIIRVGSEVYDTSLRGQLRRLSLNLGK
jgi:F-type H+-transporting ATPase subunit delta